MSYFNFYNKIKHDIACLSRTTHYVYYVALAKKRLFAGAPFIVEFSKKFLLLYSAGVSQPKAE